MKKNGAKHFQFNKTKICIFSKGNGPIVPPGEKKGKKYSAIVPTRIQVSIGLKGDRRDNSVQVDDHYLEDWDNLRM